ncbi:TniQ family protein [Rhizobium sp.]|uniref:TniQ family protein n=1 Tax=Rhizobium sp. TaxID=391 RepID=UPI002897C39A
MALPVSLSPNFDEPPVEFAARLAKANGYSSLRTLLNSAQIDGQKLRFGDLNTLNKVANLAGSSLELQAKYSVPKSSVGGRWKLGHAQFTKETRRGSRIRICPCCILNDVEHETGRPFSGAYFRASWQTRAVSNCARHRRPILEMTVPTKRVREFSNEIAANIDLIRSAASDQYTAIDVSADKYLEDRIHGIASNQFLDTFEAHVIVDLASYLGTFILANQAALACSEIKLLPSDPRSTGFLLISQGEKKIRDVMATIIGYLRPANCEAIYSNDFGRWLRRNASLPEFANVVELFQDIGERNLPFGVGDVCIIPTRRRYLHSIKSASKEYGVTVNRISKLLVENGILAEVTRSYKRTYFSVEAANDLILAAHDTTTAVETKKLLDITEGNLAQIIKAGLLPRVEVPVDGRVFTRIKKADIEAFQKRLFADVVFCDIPKGFRPIKVLARRYGVRLEQVLKLIMDRAFEKVIAKPASGRKVTNLYVQAADAKKALRSQIDVNGSVQTNLLTVSATIERLRAKIATVRFLYTHGFLQPIEHHAFGFMKQQVFIKEDDLNKFMSEYVSVSEMARVHGTHAIVVTEELEARGINPAFISPPQVAKFYNRSDVVGVHFVRRTESRYRRPRC